MLGVICFNTGVQQADGGCSRFSGPDVLGPVLVMRYLIIWPVPHAVIQPSVR